MTRFARLERLARFGRLVGLVAVVALPAFALLAQSAPGNRPGGGKQGSEDWSAICRKIESLNEEMETSLREGDLIGVAELYADDAVLLGPRGQRVTGRVAIDRYWNDLRGAKDWQLTIDRLGGDAESVYELGKSRLVTASSGRERLHEVEFLVVWKRAKDGGWRIAADVFNFTPPSSR